MNRRQFCERMLALGATVAVAPLVEACGRVVATPPAAPASTRVPTPTAAATTAAPTPLPPPATATSEPTAVPSATPTPDPTLAAIALVSTTDRAAGVRRAIELLGINPHAAVHDAPVMGAQAPRLLASE